MTRRFEQLPQRLRCICTPRRVQGSCRRLLKQTRMIGRMGLSILDEPTTDSLTNTIIRFFRAANSQVIDCQADTDETIMSGFEMQVQDFPVNHKWRCLDGTRSEVCERLNCLVCFSTQSRWLIRKVSASFWLIPLGRVNVSYPSG